MIDEDNTRMNLEVQLIYQPKLTLSHTKESSNEEKCYYHKAHLVVHLDFGTEIRNCWFSIQSESISLLIYTSDVLLIYIYIYTHLVSTWDIVFFFSSHSKLIKRKYFILIKKISFYLKHCIFQLCKSKGAASKHM